jgi:GTP cyclohydrolase I
MIAKQNYEKIEQYDEELTASLADNYKTIIADLGRCK